MVTMVVVEKMEEQKRRGRSINIGGSVKLLCLGPQESDMVEKRASTSQGSQLHSQSHRKLSPLSFISPEL